MSYTRRAWSERIANRVDISTGLVHLTRSTEEQSVLKVLLKILLEKKLIGSSNKGFICGDRKAVCFQDAPLYSIAQNVYFEDMQRLANRNYKKRYEPYGLAFPKDYLFNKDARPVVYEKTDRAKKFLPREDWWRIVRFDLSKPEGFIDWTHEREWRLPGDLEFDLSKTILVCVHNKEVIKIAKDYKRKTGKELRDIIRGVATLGDILI